MSSANAFRMSISQREPAKPKKKTKVSSKQELKGSIRFVHDGTKITGVSSATSGAGQSISGGFGPGTGRSSGQPRSRDTFNMSNTVYGSNKPAALGKVNEINSLLDRQDSRWSSLVSGSFNENMQ